MSQAYVSEMFSGIQGEGPWAGYRQLFLRFSGCDLRCNWCDTPASLVANRKRPASLEGTPGERDFFSVSNPVTLNTLLEAISLSLGKLSHHSITLTGGEPLLQSRFLASLADAMRSEMRFPPRLYLETGGHRPCELENILPYLSFVSCDLKISSSTGQPTPWEMHARFLRLCRNLPGYAKIVFDSSTRSEEIERACELIILTESPFELLLQPVSQIEHPPLQGNVIESPSPERYLRLQEVAISLLGAERVRVLPQVHKLMQQL